MEWADIAKILTAIGGPTTIVALYKWAVSHGKREALAEQTQKTLAAKDEEIAELQAEIDRLTTWVDNLTTPPGRST